MYPADEGAFRRHLAEQIVSLMDRMSDDDEVVIKRKYGVTGYGWEITLKFRTKEPNAS